jgi:hypothetical protein
MVTSRPARGFVRAPGATTVSTVEDRLRALELEVVDLRRALDRMATETERQHAALALQLREAGAARLDAHEVVVANVGELYATLARHWRTARERVASVVAGPGGGARTLESVPPRLFVTALKIALGLGAGAGSLGIGEALDPILAGLARLVGAGEVAEATVNAWIEAHRDRSGRTPGFEYLVTQASTELQRLGTPGRPPLRSAERAVDPTAYFGDAAARLRALAAALAEADTFDDDLAALPGERAAMFAPAGARSAAREAVAALAESPAWAQVRAHYFWKLLFAHPDEGDEDDRWGTADMLIEQAMRRLAWTLYCRAQWASRASNFEVMLRDDFLLNDSKAWAEKNPRDWPRAAWTTAGFQWPAHFLQHIVPDFDGWESDPESPLQGDDPAEHALAEYRHAHETHFSRAVYHCCQVRPGKAMKGTVPIDLFIAGAEDFVKGFAATGKRAGQKSFAAARGDAHLVDVTIRVASAGATAASTPIPLAANAFEGAPRLVTESPLALTATVRSEDRRAARVHVYVFGPIEQALTAAEFFDAPEDPTGGALSYTAVSLEAGAAEVRFPALEPDAPGIYALLLGPAATPEAGDAASPSPDVFFFEFDWP